MMISLCFARWKLPAQVSTDADKKGCFWYEYQHCTFIATLIVCPILIAAYRSFTTFCMASPLYTRTRFFIWCICTGHRKFLKDTLFCGRPRKPRRLISFGWLARWTNCDEILADHRHIRPWWQYSYCPLVYLYGKFVLFLLSLEMMQLIDDESDGFARWRLNLAISIHAFSDPTFNSTVSLTYTKRQSLTIAQNFTTLVVRYASPHYCPHSFHDDTTQTQDKHMSKLRRRRDCHVWFALIPSVFSRSRKRWLTSRVDCH